MSKGQGRDARIERLSDGGCPVHGINMPQVSKWDVDADGRSFAIVECPRKDCDIQARCYDPVFGAWALTEPFWYLLDQWVC